MSFERRPSGVTFAVALIAAVVAVSCHCGSAMDPFRPPGAGGGGGVGGVGGASPTCTADAFRCKGAELQVCDPEGDPPWHTIKTCPSALTCDAQAGLCHVCEPGDFRCAGWQLEMCNAEGAGFDRSAQCTSSVYCDATGGRCRVCLSGEADCNGATLNVCNPAGDGWTATECQSADLCNERSQTCRPCVVGELQCDGLNLQQCVEGALGNTWELVAPCATPELCDATVAEFGSTGAAGWTGQCQPPACQPGAFQCSELDGRRLLGCPPSQMNWELIDTCDTAALCNAAAGICETGCGPGITPGSYRCEGAELQQCNPTGTGFDTVKTCASEAHCNATRQDCVPCLPGEYQCNGSALQICTPELTWETEEECASAVLCLAFEARCELPTCQAGAFDCAGNVLRQCSADRTYWEPQEYCVTDALCDEDAGHCNPRLPRGRAR